MFRRRPAEVLDPLLTAPLPDRVATAHTRMAHQHDPALVAALSERELAQEREVAEAVRDHGRQEELARVSSAQNVSAEIRRAQEAIVRAEAADLVVARKALAEQRRQASAHSQVAALYRQKTWASRALAGVVIGAMLYSAVNVQQNLAPGGKGDPLFWASYLLEALISTVLVVFMINSAAVARWGITQDEALIRWIEGVLLAMSIGLNTYPYVQDGDLFNVAVHSVAPVMVGVALFAHTAVMRRYGLAIDHASTAADEAGDDIAERLAALADTGHRVNLGREFADRPDSDVLRIDSAMEQRSSQQSTHLVAEHERSTLGATEQRSITAEQTAAEHPHGAPLRSSIGNSVPAPHTEGAALWSTPATAAEHSTVLAAVKTVESGGGSAAAAESLTVPRTTAPHSPAHLLAPTDTTSVVTIGDEASVLFTGAEAERDPGLGGLGGVVSSEGGHSVADTAAALRSTDAEQPAERVNAEQPATAPLCSAEHNGPATEQRSTATEHERSTRVAAEHVAEQATEQPRADRDSAEQPMTATGHIAEHPLGDELDAEVRSVAQEVKETVRARADVERIARAIAHHDATGDPASRVARDLGMGYTSVDKWLTAATEIRHGRAGGQVIQLHHN